MKRNLPIIVLIFVVLSLIFVSIRVLAAGGEPNPTCEDQKINGDYNCDGQIDNADYVSWKTDFKSNLSSLVLFEKWRRAFYSKGDTTPSPKPSANPSIGPSTSPTPSVHNFPSKKSKFNFCANVNLLNIYEGLYANKNFQKQVKDLGINYIRIPGGTVSAYWDWSRGGLKDSEEIKKLIDHPDPDIYYKPERYEKRYHTIEALSNFLVEIDIPAIFVLNMISSDLDSEIMYLKEFENRGIPIRYVELGNEFYLERPPENLQNLTSSEYSNTAPAWISRIRKEFPNVEISYIGRRIKSVDDPQKSWNDGVKNIDLDNVTIHYYGASRGIKSLDDTCGIVKTCVQERPDVTTSQWDKYFGSAVYDTRTLDLTVKSLGGNVNLWFTEYNVAEENTSTAGTWGHGLFLVNQSLMLLSDNDVEMACVHTITTNNHWGLIWKYNREYSAGGYTMQYFGQVANKAVSMEPIILPNAKTATVDILGEDLSYKQQYGYVFEDKSGKKKILLVNVSSEELYGVDVSKHILKGSFKQMHQEPGKLINSIEDIKERTKQFDDGKFMLLPYSVTIVE